MGRESPRGSAAWRAARSASLVTAAVLVLLLSRSEIRKNLLPRPEIVVPLAAVIWTSVFVLAWRRNRSRGPRA